MDSLCCSVDQSLNQRTFVGIGVVMASLALIATRKGWRGWWNRGVLLVLVAAAWACITITYAYANAQAAQQGLNQQVLQSLTPNPAAAWTPQR